MSVTFEVGHKKFKIPLNRGYVVDPYCKLVPHKFQELCSAYAKRGTKPVRESDYVYPHLNPHAFSLFINLMLTPTGLEIYNPKNLGLKDLIPIFHTFTHYSDTDAYRVNSLKDRFRNDNSE